MQLDWMWIAQLSLSYPQTNRWHFILHPNLSQPVCSTSTPEVISASVLFLTGLNTQQSPSVFLPADQRRKQKTAFSLHLASEYCYSWSNKSSHPHVIQNKEKKDSFCPCAPQFCLFVYSVCVCLTVHRKLSEGEQLSHHSTVKTLWKKRVRLVWGGGGGGLTSPETTMVNPSWHKLNKFQFIDKKSLSRLRHKAVYQQRRSCYSPFISFLDFSHFPLDMNVLLTAAWI